MSTDQQDKTAGIKVEGQSVFAHVPGIPSPVPDNDLRHKEFERRMALPRADTQFSPDALLAVIVGLLALGACIAPWPHHGWLYFELISTIVALFVLADAILLSHSREDYAPVLLPPERGLRGREGQIIQVPLAFTATRRVRRRHVIHVGLMPATQESETAFHVKRETERLQLGNSGSGNTETQDSAQIQLWPWTPEITLLRRGLWPGPRVGTERRSYLKIWRMRQWFQLPEPLRIEADLRAERREILRSQVYRTLVAAQQTPWTGHGRDFERLREYQPGDNYSEIAWKSTARRGAPVSRLFQWEQKQEVYFVLDQSRASALALEPGTTSESADSKAAAPPRILDLIVKTALIGATVALELGDEFGLVTYAEEPKFWLRAGSGQAHFRHFRERLLTVEPFATTADYETLFSDIRARLRRRAYLLLLGDFTQRSVADSLQRGIGLVRSSHAILMTSVLPAHAQPAFSPGKELHTDQDVYAELTGEKENQRLGALTRKMRHLNVQLRYVPAERFVRSAVEGYLVSKREQRL